MGSEWFKNMCGVQLTDKQMENIPHTRTELGIHVSTKFAQMFGIMGTCIVGPIAGAVNKDTRNWPDIKNKMTTMGTGGVALGFVVGPLLTYSLMKKEDDYRVWDRCYRIRHSRNQVHVDQLSLLGTACGAGVAAYTGNGAAFGGLIGMTSGVILAALFNSATKKSNKN